MENETADLQYVDAFAIRKLNYYHPTSGFRLGKSSFFYRERLILVFHSPPPANFMVSTWIVDFSDTHKGIFHGCSL